MHRVNYRYYCHFPGLEFMKLPHRVKGLFLKEEERGYSQNSLLLGNLYWEGQMAMQKNRRLMGKSCTTERIRL